MKINKKLIFQITIILLLLWCFVIFLFSANKGSDSSKQSGFVVNFIIEHNLEWFIPEIVRGGSLELNVRKLAHMTEYAILEVLSYLFLYQVTRRKLIRINRIVTATVGSLVMSFIYACLDEYHQTFVPNRVGSFADVLIDMRGVLAGLIISTVFVMILYIYRIVKYRNLHILLEK